MDHKTNTTSSDLSNIMNDLLFVSSHINQKTVKKQTCHSAHTAFPPKWKVNTTFS